MRILYLTLIETCSEAQDAYDIFFSDKITEEFIDKFSAIGKIVYTNIYYKKYFRVIVKGKYTLKGFIENDDMRVLFPNSEHLHHLDELKQFISSL